jgi:hypothetical protein
MNIMAIVLMVSDLCISCEHRSFLHCESGYIRLAATPESRNGDHWAKGFYISDT